MSAIQLYCGWCNAQLEADELHAGRVVLCPNCHQRVPVPGTPQHIQKPQANRALPRRQAASAPALGGTPAGKVAATSQPTTTAPLSHFLWAGVLGLILGGTWTGGCASLFRYSSVAYKAQVARGDRAEKQIAELAPKQKELEAALAQARGDAEKARQELAELRTQTARARPPEGAGTSGGARRHSNDSTETTLGKASAEPRDTDRSIPADVVYSVIDDNRNGRLWVRLNRTVSDNILRNIAIAIKKQRPHSEYRDGRRMTFFYLPGMDSSAEAWASASLNPNSAENGGADHWTVAVFGLSVDEERRLAESTSAQGQQGAIGAWLDETIGAARRLTIVQRQGNVVVEHRFKDGSGDETAVTEVDCRGGGKFAYDKAPGRSRDGYFLINSKGELEEWVRFDRDAPIPSGIEINGDYGLYMRARRVP